MAFEMGFRSPYFIVPLIFYVDKKRRGTPIDDASPVVRQQARDKALQVTTWDASIPAFRLARLHQTLATKDVVVSLT